MSGFLAIRTLFQTIRPTYSSLKMMSAPRCPFPLIVDAFHRVPRGGSIPSRLSSPAISRGGRPRKPKISVERPLLPPRQSRVLRRGQGRPDSRKPGRRHAVHRGLHGGERGGFARRGRPAARRNRSGARSLRESSGPLRRGRGRARAPSSASTATEGSRSSAAMFSPRTKPRLWRPPATTAPRKLSTRNQEIARAAPIQAETRGAFAGADRF